MKKAESEQAIRHLFYVWFEVRGFTGDPAEHLSFSDFKSWLGENHYSLYLKFRSVRGAEADAELWFDDELKQMWCRLRPPAR